MYLLWVWATASAVAQIIFFAKITQNAHKKTPVGFIACGLYFLYDTSKEVRLVGQYIARLMMIGFSARSAYEIYKDFQAEHDFAGLISPTHVGMNRLNREILYPVID